jgi:hypothetical protein
VKTQNAKPALDAASYFYGRITNQGLPINAGRTGMQAFPLRNCPNPAGAGTPQYRKTAVTCTPGRPAPDPSASARLRVGKKLFSFLNSGGKTA